MKMTCHKKFSVIAIAFLLSLFAHVNAASLSLTKIGALDTGGATYSDWWYTGTSPTLAGTAGSSADVSIKIGDDTSSVTADSGGNWTYATSLEENDYSITISSGDESYAFTLHAGQVMPADVGSSDSSETTEETAETTSTEPATGYPQVFGLATSISLLGIGAYLYLKNKKSTKRAYVRSVLKSLD